MNSFKSGIKFHTYPLYILLLAAHISLVWWLPYFPTQDGPSHIYNLAILKDLLNGGQLWGDYYYNDLRPVPNLGFHIFAYPLLAIFTPETTERLFITIYLILMASSVPFFMRSFNKPAFPFSFFVFPVMFNFNLMMGFYSYSIAVPVFLLAFGYCYQIRNSSFLNRFIIYNLVGCAIFYLHLIAFGLFILSLYCMTLSESVNWKNIPRKSINLALVVSPALVNLIVYFLSCSKGTSDIPVRYIAWSDRVVDLITFSIATFTRWQIALGCILFYILVRYYINGLLNEKRRCGHESVNSSENNTGCLHYLAGSLVLICLFSPFMMGDGSYFNQRFPWVILLTILPALHDSSKSISRRMTAPMLISFTVLLFIANASVMLQKNSYLESFMKGLAVDIPKGAYVMTFKAYDNSFRIDVLLHAASYYGLKKKVVIIGNFEATKDLFPVRFKNTLPTLPPIDQVAYDANTINWSEFPAINYLLVWQADDKSESKLMPYYRQSFKAEDIAVWHRI